MDISNWQILYKANNTHTQMVYEPRISPDNKIFCMNFQYACTYQTQQTKNYPETYTEHFVHEMFVRELEFQKFCRSKSWCPKIIDVDYESKRIFLVAGRNLTEDPSEQNRKAVRDVIKDQWQMGMIKLTVYPHSHMIHSDGTITAIDFYASVEKHNPYVAVNSVLPLMGASEFRFRSAQQEDRIDLLEMFKHTLLRHSQWPGDMIDLYEEIF
ncbi:MAG: hypothetical protein EBX50_09600 [Chitinophagia bacterium]|nr:hypothetical protein [Chitinophagia bacterium]